MLDENSPTLIVMPYSFIDEFLVKERKFMQDGGKMVILTPEIKEFCLEYSHFGQWFYWRSINITLKIMILPLLTLSIGRILISTFNKFVSLVR